MGSGDFACSTYNFNSRDVKTYVNENPSNPQIITVPPGERYQNLSAQEYEYTAEAGTNGQGGGKEALLELKFKTRLVPLFQFAVFYNKDLEILPGPNMTLSGPVYTNGDLYLYSNSGTLTMQGQTMAAGSIYRGRKDGTITPSCNNQLVQISDGASLRSLIPSMCVALSRPLHRHYSVGDHAADAHPTGNGARRRRLQSRPGRRLL